VLVLDEATSSVDTETEALIQDALEKLMRGRTSIIIAHRLSTIQHVDQIITLRGGKIDEIGSPRQLARTNGIYAQLLQLQQGKKTESTKKKLQQFEIAA
jgi:ATP-binding cassette subfamily B protein